MYQLIKEWQQDGFDLTAYTVPDEMAGHPRHEVPAPAPDSEYYETWRTMINRYDQEDWSWVGVIVEASLQGVKLGEASLWAIESDQPDYHKQVADELADEAVDDADTTLTRILAQYQHSH